MSSPKFMVIKLKDLRIPILIFLVVIALFVFLLIKNKTTQTFAPSDTYQDGKYIAGITLSDAQMDLVVEVKNHTISSVALSGLDESSTMLYKDLLSGIDYVNTYITTTQSLELPSNANTSPATNMLMDAVKVALSDNDNASITSTYEKLDLTPSAASTGDNAEEDIFVDEFADDTLLDNTATTDNMVVPDNAEAATSNNADANTSVDANVSNDTTASTN